MALNDWGSKLNGVVAQGTTALGTAEAVAQLFGVSVADAIGINTNNQSRASQGFDLQNFRATYDKAGFMKTNLFLLDLPIPPVLRNIYGANANRDLILYSDAITLPTVTWFMSDNIRHWGYGPVESRPYGANFSDITISFVVDGKAELYKYFVNWMNGIVNFDRTHSHMHSTTFTGAQPYEVSYKKEYVQDIKIIIYDPATNKILTCTLKDAYPMSIDPIQMNWGTTDELARLPVTFKFTDWRTDALDETNLQDTGSLQSSLSFYQAVQKGISVAQTIASLQKPRSIGDILNVVNNASVILNGF